MRLKVMAAGLVTLMAFATESRAATLDYRCSSSEVAHLLETTKERGHKALFYYRLNRAIADGQCTVTGESVAAEPKVALGTSGAQYRYRENRFPPPWLFRPLR